MPTKSLSWLLITLLLCLSIVYAVEINKDKDNFLLKDYGKFYQATQFFLKGESIYSAPTKIQKTSLKHSTLLNPPFFILLLLPLGLLSYPISLWLWSLISIACGIISVLFLLKILNFQKQQLNYVLGFFLAFFVYYPTFTNMQFGQVTLFLMPLITGAWLAARQKNYYWLGILLGIAASIKPFIGLFFLYLLIRCEWRALACFLITLFICSLLASIVFGYHSYIDYFYVLQSVNWYSASWNDSLLGFLLRLFGGKEINTPLISLPWLTYKLYYLIEILLLGMYIKFIWPIKKINLQKKLDIDFSLTIVVMLLLSPLAWLYYFPFLIIPFIVLLQLAKEHQSINLYLASCFGILLSGISHLSTTPAKITPDNTTSIFLLSSCNVAALLMLLIALFFANKRLSINSLTTTGTLSLSTLEWITFYVIVLLPSLFSILNTVNVNLLFNISYHFGN